MRRTRRWVVNGGVAVLALVAGCGGGGSGGGGGVPAPDPAFTIAAAGDIGQCGGAPAAGSAAAKTAALAEMISAFTAEAAKREGNLVVEAAPRSLKEKVNVWGQTRSDTVVVRRLKEKIDPAGVLNPGRFVGGI